jgi:hypothetical protein
VVKEKRIPSSVPHSSSSSGPSWGLLSSSSSTSSSLTIVNYYAGLMAKKEKGFGWSCDSMIAVEKSSMSVAVISYKASIP